MAFHPLVEGLELRKLLAADAAADLPPADAGLSAPPQSILADLNRDGRADEIAVVHAATGVSSVLRVSLGKGNGTFVLSDSIKFDYNTAVAVAAGDLNGDGLVDVSVVGENPLSDQPSGVNVYVVTFFGNGDGRFKRTPGPTANANPPPLAHMTFIPGISRVNGLVVGDLDGTQFGDVAVLGQLHSSSAATTNPSSGIVVAWDPTLPTFAPVAPTIITLPALTSVDRLYHGDLDGDGSVDLVAVRSTPLPPSLLAVVRPDLVTVRFSNSRIASVRAGTNPLYLNLATPVSNAAAVPTTFGLDDVDGDHVPDLVGSAGSAIRYSSFVRSSAAGASSAAKTAVSLGLPAGASLRDLRLGDLDNDGLADLLGLANGRPSVGLNITGHSPLANALNQVTFAWSPVRLTPTFDVLTEVKFETEPRMKASLFPQDELLA